MSQTEGQPSSGFNMPIPQWKGEACTGGNERKEATELEHHSLDKGRADAHCSHLGVTYHNNKAFPEKLHPLPLPFWTESLHSHHQMGTHPE